MAISVPKHLERYCSEQTYSNYSYEDQAVWRFSMKQLHRFLKDHAHEAYESGLEKTGISIEQIPRIHEMNDKLSEFGWGAVPVSGFIPPAAFMSFQANSILPIACEIRSFEHILYTPAPDIIHEAGGHAPILIDPDFSSYLKSYAASAAKAIISSEDLALYEAIRELSDIKEHKDSSPESIKQAEVKLDETVASMSYVSEAQYLGRMNWWTAEYGLIGSLEAPKIFGAGLLSSIGESRDSLTVPKHIPLSLECLDFGYDITEPQPQLFVAESFKSLSNTLDNMTESMAFKVGGQEGLAKAVRSKSVCTIVVDSGKVFSGQLEDFGYDNQELKFLSFKAPILTESFELLEEDKVFTFEKHERVTSVYGGPLDFEKFPSFIDFDAKKITQKQNTENPVDEVFKLTRKFREESEGNFSHIEELYFDSCPNHWLAGIEILELHKNPKVQEHLLSLQGTSHEDVKTCISLGLEAINEH